MYGLCETKGYQDDVVHLEKKYRRIRRDLTVGLATLAARPRDLGDPIPNTPSLWKARLGIPSQNIGKRDGLRVIYRIDDPTDTIVLVELYSKAELSNVSAKELQRAAEAVEPLLVERARELGLDPMKLWPPKGKP